MEQQTTRSDEIAALLDEVIPRLDALRDAALREILEASEEARKNVSRHGEATEELAGVEAQIARLSAERESLPDKAYRAGLDEDYELEDSLKERYKNLKPALEGLEERRESLRAEIARLNPDGEGHPNNVTIEHYARAASVASKPRHELEALKEKLTKALDAAIDPVVAKHDSLKGITWQMSHSRAWAESPAGRGGVPS